MDKEWRWNKIATPGVGFCSRDHHIVPCSSVILEEDEASVLVPPYREKKELVLDIILRSEGRQVSKSGLFCRATKLEKLLKEAGHDVTINPDKARALSRCRCTFSVASLTREAQCK